MSNYRADSCEEAVQEVIFRNPSILGRLIAVAVFREREPQQYRELSHRYGTPNVDKALRQLHIEVFLVWLNFSLSQQTQDLKVYCHSTGAADALEGLLALVERSIPAGSREAARRLVLSDLEVVTALVRAEV